MEIETIGIPLLLKVVDFLFGEGSKILQERRERRKAEQKAESAKPEVTGPPSPGKLEVADAIRSKEDAFSQRISEFVWSDLEAEIQHLMTMLEIYTKNYRLAKEQYALWGKILVPTIIVHNLTFAEDGVAATMKELQAALSKIYGKKVIAPEVERDCTAGG